MASSFKILSLLGLLFLSAQLKAQLMEKTAPFEVRLGLNHSRTSDLSNKAWMGANASFLLIYPFKKKKIRFVTGFEFKLVRHEELEKLPPDQDYFLFIKNKGLVSIPVLARYPFFRARGFVEGGISLDLIGVGGQAGLGFKFPIRGDFITLSITQQYSIIPHWKQKHQGLEVGSGVMITKLNLGILVTKKEVSKIKKRGRVTH